jgi:hypothetical protein
MLINKVLLEHSQVYLSMHYVSFCAIIAEVTSVAETM